MEKKQVKSRERVAAHGEVFTAEREVKAMCDLVAQECDRIDSRFLEPACGDGNFTNAAVFLRLEVDRPEHMLRTVAKKLIGMWDGEDEELADIIDGKISTAMWISSAALVVSYFLIAASYSAGFAAFDSRLGTYAVFASIVGFLAIMVETIVIQQMCVDAAKHTNPVKDVSVYDMKFQKKWVDSCDEAEKIMIGKCAYKAYTATGTVCAVLAIVLAVCALVFGIGFLPSLVVCLIWLVNLSVYCREAMRCSKAGIKIP